VVIIAVDAMGGDAAPGPEVAGAVAAVQAGAVEVVLVGDRAALDQELERLDARELAGLRVEHAEQVVTMDDAPTAAFRTKRSSSLRRATDLVGSGAADALVSAGNSGAVLAHALLVLGRLPGVERPAIATSFPTVHGPVTLCDAGGNVDVRPSMLVQFAVLGAAYDQVVHGRARPRVGLLSNGSEPGKGTELTRAAHQLLTAAAARPGAGFELVGYVEGSDLWTGAVDVVATDGFTGNVVLKLFEGMADSVLGLVRRELQRGPLALSSPELIAPALRAVAAELDHTEVGGALLAGVAGTVVLAHGRSDATAITSAIGLADRFARAGLPERLAAALPG